MQALAGILVVDFTRYLPGAYASRELVRLGARVVRVESTAGDPMRETAPAWDAALRAGTESVICDLKADTGLALALCSRADVVLESFRPGVAARLGIGPDDVPASTVYCSITGFGTEGVHAARAGHDLNYLGWAGVLEDTAPEWPPVQVADLAAGALGAVVRILAALLERARTGTGARITVSMTHGSHDLVAHRVGGEPVAQMLTGGLACYRAYATQDGRHLTVAALEPKFFGRLCELLGRQGLLERQYAPEQAALADELAEIFSTRSLAEWLEHFGDEDVCVGPVWTRREAASQFGTEPSWASPGSGRAHSGLAPRPRGCRGRHARPYDTERPSAAGSARSVSIRSGSSGRRPSRSSEDRAHPERASAGDVVLVGVAHHCRFAGLHVQYPEGCDEDGRMRLGATVQPRSDHRVHVERVMGDELLEIPLPVRDEPDLQLVPAKLVEDGERVLVEREVLVSLPLAHHVGRALPGAVRVATHAANDLLRERDPDLVVVDEAGFALQRLDGSGACVLVATRIEREPVSLPHAPIPLGPELRTRSKEREIDVEENRAKHRTRIAPR